MLLFTLMVMSIRPAESIEEERLRWIMPILEKKLSIVQVASIAPYSERSLKRWIKIYKEKGIEGLVPKSTRPKSHPNETPIRIKEAVIALRKKTGLCAKKLHWRLKKTEGLCVPISTISKIIKEEGLTRPYRTRRISYKHIKQTRMPGELIEIDVKHVPAPIAGKKYYQYTAIDTASRWRHLVIYEQESTYNSIQFLTEVIRVFPYPITAIKTDNHSVFTNRYVGANKRSDRSMKQPHALDVFCATQGIVHYLIDTGSPTQNGKVERSHREDNNHLYHKYTFSSPTDLKRKLRIWNNYYNNLEHCSLDGKTPNEVLKSFVPDVLG